MVRAPSFTTKWRTPTWLKHGKLKTKTFIVIYTRTQPSCFEKGFQWISFINLYVHIYIIIYICIHVYNHLHISEYFLSSHYGFDGFRDLLSAKIHHRHPMSRWCWGPRQDPPWGIRKLWWSSTPFFRNWIWKDGQTTRTTTYNESQLDASGCTLWKLL